MILLSPDIDVAACIKEKCSLGISLFLILLFSSSAFGQQSQKADAYFEAQHYNVAARLYSQLLTQDSTNYHAAFYLAMSYNGLFRYEEAQQYFAYVAQQAPANFPEALYYYAQSLQKSQACDQAMEWYDRYLNLQAAQRKPELTRQAQREREGCLQTLLEMPQSTFSQELKRLPAPVNTDFQEYAPSLLGDSLLAYTSSRLQDNSMRSHRSGEGFTDQFFVEQDSLGWNDKSTVFSKLNTRDSEATGSFTADKQRYYFTRCNNKAGICQIYVARYNGTRWYAPQLLNEAINPPGTTSKHPNISPSGDTLFFVSDRTGGAGNTDVWMSLKAEQGKWQNPVNLGPAVNTSQDEIFPVFYPREQLLIFASNGREGKGGMDLYLFDMADNAQPSIPLSAPLNSSKDDCCLVVGNERAYLASNREGSFDIFAFCKDQQQTVRQVALGIDPAPGDVNNAYNQAYEDIITDYALLTDYEPQYLSVMQSGTQEVLGNGSSRFVLSADVNEILLEKLRDARALSDTAATEKTGNFTDTVAADNVLAVFNTQRTGVNDQFEVSGTIRSTSTFRAVPAVRILLLDEEGRILKITTTNERGAFRFVNLSEASKYAIVSADASEDEFLIEYDIFSYGSEVQTVKFENIYFDFNRAMLRNEARVALDELADLYRQHPASVIEINAFTDSTGNDVYNLKLSRDRGMAAFNYLLESGVNRSSLVINARGASTAASSSNSYVSQQLNRRVEFYITGRDIEYDAKVVTRMLRPKVSLYALSNSTGMPVEDIRKLNGLTDNNLPPYKPVRLYDWAVEKAPGLFYQMTVRSED